MHQIQFIRYDLTTVTTGKIFDHAGNTAIPCLILEFVSSTPTRKYSFPLILKNHL